MSGHLVVIHPHGKTVALPYASREPAIELLQALVGGYVEERRARWEDTVRLMYVAENGKLIGLLPNPLATELSKEFGYLGMPFVGVAVIDIPNTRR